MRYLLIDHITECKPGASIRGVKNVAMSEDFLEFHFPKNPIMPGVLLLEALAQLTGWLEAASSDFANWFLIGKVRKSNFYSFALPGDQIELEVELISDEGGEAEIPPLKKVGTTRFRGEEVEFSERNPNTKVYRGTGMVKGKKKIVAEFEGVIVPVNEIEEVEEQRKFFKVLTRENTK